MKHIKTLLLALLLTTATGIQAQVQTLVNRLWVDTTGHPVQNSYFQTARREGSYVYIAGSSYHQGQSANVLITKYSTTGTKIWQKEYNTSSDNADLVTDMYVKGNYYYATGTMWDSANARSNIFVLKGSIATGDTTWLRIYTGSYAGYHAGASILPDNNGNVYVGGAEQASSSNFRMLAIKYDSTGTQQWASTYDSAGYYDAIVTMGIDAAKNYLTITGFSGSGFASWDFVTTAFNLTTGVRHHVVNRSSNGNGAFSQPVGIGKDYSDNTYIAGTSAINAYNTDIKIVKYDTLFNEVWVRRWGKSDSLKDETTAFAQDVNTNLLLTGYTTGLGGAKSMLVLKYSTGGTLLWSRTVSAPDTTQNCTGKDIVADDSSNVYVTGSVSNGYDNDIITVCYDKDGNLKWQQTYASTDSIYDEGADVLVDSLQQVYVSGRSIHATPTYVTIAYKQATAYIPTDTLDPNTAYAFYQNRGQIMYNDSTAADSVLYYTNAGNPQLYINDKKLSYVIGHTSGDSVPVTDTVYRIDMEFTGSLVQPYDKKKNYHDKETPAFLNYFLGYLSQPVTNVRGYNRVVRKEVYRKIDWHMVSTRSGIKNYLVIQPGALTSSNPIRIKYSGADSIRVSNKRMTLYTQIGNIAFDSLTCYQVDGSGTKTAVTINYDSVGVNQFTYTFGSYNSANYLVVEQKQSAGPTHIGGPEWSTYFGGGGYDEGTDLAVDDDGNVYQCGFTNSGRIEAFASAAGMQPNPGGSFDGFVAKFGSATNTSFSIVQHADELQWVTYVGGNADEKAYGITTNGNGTSGKVYITGYTESSSWNVANTLGTYQQNNIVGIRDAFILGIENIDGGALNRWFTYFGGNGEETGHSIAVDGSGNIYVAGNTSTSTYSASSCTVPSDNGFPKCTTASSFNNSGSYGGGSSDGFIAKFDAGGALTWSTFYGKSADDYINDIAVDVNNDLLLTGKTASTTGFTASSGVTYNQTIIGGAYDAFITRFSSSGAHTWCTYFGGSGDDEGISVATDNNNHIFIGGSTASSTPACSTNTCLCKVPATGQFPLCNLALSPPYFQAQQSTPYLGEYGGGATDGFIAEFDASQNFVWGTYYGSDGADKVNSLAVDYESGLFFAGQTESPTGTTSDYLYQNGGGHLLASHAWAYQDVFLGFFRPDRTRGFSTYYGNSSSEWGNAIAVNAYAPGYKYFYTTGATSSEELYFWASSPCCPAAYPQSNLSSGKSGDAFMLRYSTLDMYMASVEDMETPETFDVSVYPNPFSQLITVALQLNAPSAVDVQIFSANGQLLNTQSFGSQNGTFTTNIDFSEFANGTYLLKTTTGKNAVTKKIIKYQ